MVEIETSDPNSISVETVRIFVTMLLMGVFCAPMMPSSNVTLEKYTTGMHICIHTYIHAYMHTHIHSFIHSFTHTCTNTCYFTKIYNRFYSQLYFYMYMYMYMNSISVRTVRIFVTMLFIRIFCAPMMP